MSYLNRIRPCPCRTWRCRAIYAANALIVLALAAGAVMYALAGLRMAGVI